MTPQQLSHPFSTQTQAKRYRARRRRFDTAENEYAEDNVAETREHAIRDLHEEDPDAAQRRGACRPAVL